MIAIRQIKEVKSGSITIDLPSNFHAKQVEIIILPIEEKPIEEQTVQDLLLSAPTLTDDELLEFQRVREWMNKWDVKTY